MRPRKIFRITFWTLGAGAVALVAGFAPSRLRAQAAAGCEAPPDVQAALDQLPDREPPEVTDWQYHSEKLTAFQTLLKQYPNDFFVQRAYINFMGYPYEERTRVIAEYKARHEQNPSDPDAAYLYGTTLVGRSSGEAIKLFESALRAAPAFPWPHLTLAEIYNAPVFLDKQKALAHTKSFLSACPSVFDGYDHATQLDNLELAREAATKLRAILAPRSDRKALDAYPTLWALEFKAHPPSEYGPLRKQVAEDLTRIRALNAVHTREWYDALEEGYKLAGDQKQSDWAKDERVRLFPNHWELAAREKWDKEHHYPQRDDPADKKRAYYTELLQQSAEWVKARPVSGSIWSARLNAMEHLDNIPAAEIEAAVDKYMEVERANGGPSGPELDDYSTAAEVLAKKHLEPDRLVEFAEKGLKKFDVDSKHPMYDLYATKENLSNNNFYEASNETQLLAYKADGFFELKQASKAQLTLQQLDERLQDLKPLIGDKQERRKAYLGNESDYWFLMGRLAELQDRKQDAMAYYESGLLARLEAQQKPETGEPDELADNAHRLWTELGGTKDGWSAWFGKREAALASLATLTWEDANEPLPPLNITDLNGKTWTLADLKGKETFLNFWATW